MGPCNSYAGSRVVATDSDVAESRLASAKGVMIQISLMRKILRACIEAHPKSLPFMDVGKAASSYELRDVQQHVSMLSDQKVLAVEFRKGAGLQGISPSTADVRVLDIERARRILADPVGCLMRMIAVKRPS